MNGFLVYGPIDVGNEDRMFEATGAAIWEILESETGAQQRYRLVQDMAGSARNHGRFDEILTMIMKLKQGFLEAVVFGR